MTSHTIYISIYLSKITITRRAKYVLQFLQCYGSTTPLLSLTQIQMTKVIFHNSSKTYKQGRKHSVHSLGLCKQFLGLSLFLKKKNKKKIIKSCSYLFFLSKTFWLLKTILGYGSISTLQCRVGGGDRLEGKSKKQQLHKD